MSTGSSSVNLNFNITADTKSAMASLADLKKQLATLTTQGSSNTAGASVSGSVSSYNQLIAARQKLSQVSSQTYQQETLFNQLYVSKNPQAIKAYTTSIGGLMQAYKMLGQQANQVKVVHDGLTGTLASTGSGVENFRIKADMLSTTLKNIADHAQQTGYQAQYMGRQLITFVTDPIANIIKQSTALSLSLDDANRSLTIVLNNGSLGGTTANIKALNDEATKLAETFGNVSKVDLTGAQTQIAKVAKSVADVQSLTAQATQFNAVSGLNNIQQAAQATATLYQYNNDNVNATKASIAEITSLANNSNTDIGTVVNSLGGMLPVFKQFNLGISQGQYLMAAFNSAGVSDFKTGAQALGRTLETIASKSATIGTAADGTKKKLTGLAAVVAQFNAANGNHPINVNGPDGQFNMSTAITSLASAYSKMNQQQQALLLSNIANARLAPADAAMLTGLMQQAQGYTKAMQTSGQALTSFNQGVQTFVQSPGAKMQAAMQKIKDIGINIGSQVLPYVLKLVQGLESLVQKFQKLPSGAKDFAAALAGILAIAGPIEVAFASLQNLGGTLLKTVADPLHKIFGLKTQVFGANSPEAQAFHSSAETISSSIRAAGADAATAIKEAATSFRNPLAGEKASVGDVRDRIAGDSPLDAIQQREVSSAEKVVGALAEFDTALGDSTRKMLAEQGINVPTAEQYLTEKKKNGDRQKGSFNTKPYVGESGYAAFLKDHPEMASRLPGSYQGALAPKVSQRIAMSGSTIDGLVSDDAINEMQRKLAIWMQVGSEDDLRMILNPQAANAGAPKRPSSADQALKDLAKQMAQAKYDAIPTRAGTNQIIDAATGRFTGGQKTPQQLGGFYSQFLQQLRGLQTQMDMQATRNAAVTGAKGDVQGQLNAVAEEANARAKAARAIKITQESEKADAETLKAIERGKKWATDLESFMSTVDEAVQKNSVKGNIFTGQTTTIESPALKAARDAKIKQDMLAAGGDVTKLNAANYSTEAIQALTGGKTSKSTGNLGSNLLRRITGKGPATLSEAEKLGGVGAVTAAEAAKSGEDLGKMVIQGVAKAGSTAVKDPGLLSMFNPLGAFKGIGTLGKAAKGGIGSMASGGGFLAGAAGGEGGIAAIGAAAAPVLPIVLAVGAAVALIAANWKSVSSTMGQGLKDIKSAFSGLINDVVQPFKSMLTDIGVLGGSGSASGKQWSQAWAEVGQVLNVVLEVVSKIVNFVGQYLKPIMQAVADTIGAIVHAIEAVVALMTGNWAQAGTQIKKMFIDITGVIGGLGQDLINLILAPLDLILKTVGAAAGALSHVPGFGWMKSLKTTADDAANSIHSLGGDFNNLVNQMSSGKVSPKVNVSQTGAKDAATAWRNAFNNALAQGMSESSAGTYANAVKASFEKAIQEGSPNAEKAALVANQDLLTQLANQTGTAVGNAAGNAANTAMSAATAATEAQATQFVGALQQNLSSLATQYVQDATNAFDQYRTKAKQAYDDAAKAADKSIQDQIDAINKLQAAKTLADTMAADQNQINKDQQNIVDATASYQAKYANDKYLGNNGQTLVDSLAYQKTVETNNATIQTDQQKLADDQLKQQQDAEKQALTDKKTALAAQTQLWDQTYTDQTNYLKTQLSNQLQDLSKHSIQTQQDVTTLQQNILGILDQYGVKINGSVQIFSTSWGQALEDAKRQVLATDYWNNLTTAVGNNATDLGTVSAQNFYNALTGQSAGGPGTTTPSGAGPAGGPGGNPPASPGSSAGNTPIKGLFHTGGSVGSMNSGPMDVPATLQTGEYVIQRPAVQALGVGTLNQLNNAHMVRPKFHTGGIVDPTGTANAYEGILKNTVTSFLSNNGTTIDGHTYQDAVAAIQGASGGLGSILAGSGVQAVINAALSWIGVPYLWGGTNPAIGLDCSGLVMDAYKAAGINLPRTTFQQVHDGTLVKSLSEAIAGDLLFYAGSDGTPTNPGHVGIYLGGGQMIDAPYTGARVRIEGAGRPDIIKRIIAAASGSGALPGGQSAPANPSANQILGKNLAARYGWSNGAEWNALNSVFNRESGWNNRIWNGGSTGPMAPGYPPTDYAYGIAQSLPYTKYPIAAQPPGYGGNADPTAQINWGLDYIANRYGDPMAAWNSELTRGWYHIGGLVKLAQGANVMSDGPAYLHKGEKVLTKPLSAKIDSAIKGGTGETQVNVNITGFMGSQAEIDNLVRAIQKAMPRYNRAKGIDPTRKVSSY